MEGPESDQQRSKRQDLSEKALDEGEDPLDWLRPRRPQFPSLWRLARKYLCVLATSTEAERLFSWTGFMLNKRRLSLSGESMSMQLKDNIKLWSFNGALVFASKYNHRHAHAIALHMRKPLLCTCAGQCLAHARPIALHMRRPLYRARPQFANMHSGGPERTNTSEYANCASKYIWI